MDVIIADPKPIFACHSFIHGDMNYAIGLAFDDVYVLTIPGFTWFKAPHGSGAPRVLHICEIIGNRQLVTVGGVDPAGQKNRVLGTVYQVPDPLAQGIGIFDMSAMEWMPSCNATAAP